MARVTEVTGVLIVDKPRGPTSHDVVARARRHFGTRAVGHAGTLDPLATGVLVLLFGQACKLSSYLSAAEKTYLAGVALGRATDTLDAGGRVSQEAPLARGWLGLSELEAALDAERARTAQVPPAVSAIHVDGERAHEAARRGKPPELEPRPVHVASLRLLTWSDERIELELRVSKGYYVRALARDLGERLGVPAHLAELRRTASGAFFIDEACGWPPPEDTALLPIEVAAGRALPTATLTEEGTVRARQGKPLGREHFARAVDAGVVSAWLSPDGELVALGTGSDASFRVVRGFNRPS